MIIIIQIKIFISFGYKIQFLLPIMMHCTMLSHNKYMYTLNILYYLTQRNNRRCYTRQSRDVEPMLIQCSPIVYDAGPPLNQHKFIVSYVK